MATDYAKMQQARGEEADWSASSRVLLVGEIGFLIDPTGYRMKVGNGTDAWSALPYFGEKDYELRVTVAGVEVNVADHETRIVALEAAVDTVATLQAAVDALTTQVATLEETVADHETRITALEPP